MTLQREPSTADPAWLELREGVDARARDAGAARLLGRLTQHLALLGGTELHVVDVGAGTGANQRHLSPRLPSAQR